jgi:hypothetical protein
LFVFHAPREEPNKKLKCLFFPTKAIPTYLSKEPKLTKWGQQKNKPIKSSHVEKKITLKSLKKIKHLWLFKWLFSIETCMVKKAIFIIFKMLFY